MLRDALGRRRRPAQSRGLRPLHPPLGPGSSSRAIRVAMSVWAWEALELFVGRSTEPTRPRALGQLVERALESQRVLDWQGWQIRKEKQLLERAS